MKHSKVKNQKGFTLVELAIVVAVIAILVGGIVFGGKFLMGQSKSSKVSQLVQNIHSASTMCRMKNGSAFTTGLDLTALSTMVQDSQCRTTTADGNGPLPSGIPAQGEGYTNLSVSWDSTQGALVLTITAEDAELAQSIYNELVKKLGTNYVSVSGNQVTATLKL